MYLVDDNLLAQYAPKQTPWGFDHLGYIVYKRTYARPIYDDHGEIIRTEEWPETIQRVINGAQQIGAKLTQAEAERLFDHMFNLRGLPGGRMLWRMGGPVAHGGPYGDDMNNCWFTTIESTKDFAWIFERLMLGGGVGFSITTPETLGTVRQGTVIQHNVSDADYIVPDKREGWAECLLRALDTYLGNEDHPHTVTYSTQLIRPAGAPIKTFGGTASGPAILNEGITKICAVLDTAVGRHLTSVEALDICNIIGSIVVAGNVRRSAQIALGKPTDTEYLSAKRWDLGTIPAYRAMSNNTVIANRGEVESLNGEFWDGYLGNGEPYGLFNLETSQRYGRMGEERQDDTVAGTNPCSEISLANKESCNLAEMILPNIRSLDEMIDVSKLLYKVQKAVAALPYIDRESTRITHQNMRLGLGVTGITQALDKLDWLSPTYEALRHFDAEWSAEQGYPQSVRLTTVKPSGTLSLLAGVTPGVHPGFARYHIRRVRMSSHDPLLDYCAQRGYTIEWVRGFDGMVDERTKVVEFPCAFPTDTMLAHDVTAIDQIALQRRMQADWADNAVSVTVYYRKDELDAIKAYLVENWDDMKSVSFLLHSEHGFEQAPLEAIDRTTYKALLAKVNKKPQSVAAGTSELLDDDYSSGACPIR